MKTLNLLTATLDDIVFDGRNQAYGAYLLRRLYKRHLATALAATLALCLVLFSIPMLVQRLSPTVADAVLPVDRGIIDLELITILPPTPPAVAPPVAPPPTRAVVTKANPADVISRVVPDELVTKPISMEKVIGETTTPGAVVGPVAIPRNNTGVVTDISSAGTDSGKTGAGAITKPFLTAEVMPDFVGGPEALRRYMQRNLRFPSQAASAAVSGRVYISFTVNADGSISDVAVIKGLGYGTDEEAIRVISKMPPWSPGRQNDHAVPVRYTMPITFQYQ
ncbi:TonB family protein [Hymenobacter roseosalivarius DSM 11622]|uniref:TonB family protein n=1 Tax=Hymenobacter roseosalivarius DSM 11622 TaxID=645990 RepID=A0A1W1UZR4_9BACT|nr:energy transducer TonB [Hymenobacter roseosalivarius]SMB86595.1 TonB family protein [Hymenobacter roseosalivarius DSM 11622]